jgi:hypothetical protein
MLSPRGLFRAGLGLSLFPHWAISSAEQDPRRVDILAGLLLVLNAKKIIGELPVAAATRQRQKTQPPQERNVQEPELIRDTCSLAATTYFPPPQRIHEQIGGLRSV